MQNSDKVAKLIEESGHDFHLEIADFLEGIGWTIQIGPYFNDPVTGKPREIDIIAEKQFNVTDTFFDHQHDSFKVRLFIECKYVKDDIVVWRRPKNMEKAKALVGDVSLLKTEVNRGTAGNHHYFLNEGVVKLGTKSGKTDVLYEGMNGTLSALIFHRNHAANGVRHVINYPVIVINNSTQINERDAQSKKGYKAIQPPFQLEVDYSFRDKDGGAKTEYFLIDIVDQLGLKRFCETLSADDISLLKRSMGDILFNKGKQLRESQDRRQSGHSGIWI